MGDWMDKGLPNISNEINQFDFLLVLDRFSSGLESQNLSYTP